MKKNEMYHNHEEHCNHKHENGVCKHEDGYEHPIHKHNNKNNSNNKCHCGCNNCDGKQPCECGCDTCHCNDLPKGHCCD